jgi:hypothetical protein
LFQYFQPIQENDAAIPRRIGQVKCTKADANRIERDEDTKNVIQVTRSRSEMDALVDEENHVIPVFSLGNALNG